jgi:hypothetical protein
MKERLDIAVNRRDLLRVAMTGAVAVATPTSAIEAAVVKPEDRQAKRKARYQANSPEVQDFYRVNRYPR